MFSKTDPYTFKAFNTLYNGVTNAIGSISLEYQVTSCDDVWLNDVGSVVKSRDRKYFLHCTQRIVIFNEQGMSVKPSQNISSFENYPVLLNTTMLPDTQGSGFQLLEYSPITINTQVQTSGVSGTNTGTTSGSTTSNTVGSSTSQTNSYSASVNLSEMGGITATAEHSSTTTQDQSRTTGSELTNNRGAESSASSAMSMKDWGSYSLVDPSTNSPSWIFGQEYPWDAIECRLATQVTNPSNANQVYLNVPTAMTVRLFDATTNPAVVYPPSQLSLFGLNFIMKAMWQVTIPNGSLEEVAIKHLINYFSASHVLVSAGPGSNPPATVSIYMDAAGSMLSIDPHGPTDVSTTLNLPLMALDPLHTYSKVAIVGFIPNKFIIPPVAATSTASTPTAFEIISTSNNLMINDTTNYKERTAPFDAGFGFTASDTSLLATLTKNCQSLEATVYFKVIDAVRDYTLNLKHWKTNTQAVMLTFLINEIYTITKYVDASEAEGGENNLLSIDLRHQDFASIEYHDYLQLGLNSIQITIQPLGIFTDCAYQIRAISIESD